MRRCRPRFADRRLHEALLPVGPGPAGATPVRGLHFFYVAAKHRLVGSRVVPRVHWLQPEMLDTSNRNFEEARNGFIGGEKLFARTATESPDDTMSVPSWPNIVRMRTPVVGFVREAEAGLGCTILLVLDNAGRHGAAGLKIPDGIRLVYPYSPELQPAETLWALVDEPIVNKHIATIEELDTKIAQQCVALAGEPGQIQSRTISIGGQSQLSRIYHPEIV